MLHFILWGASEKLSGLDESLGRLWPNEAVRSELVEILDLLDDSARHLEPPLTEPVGVPLRLHARYTRDEIMAAIGASTPSKPKALREGAYYDKPTQTDVFFVTLQKSEKDYSPTTLYRDYAISRELFHWETQSKTSVASSVGQRYITTARPLIFAREKRANDLGEAGAFLCMGPASFVSYENERPMAITWRLDHPLPADFFEVARVAAS